MNRQEVMSSLMRDVTLESRIVMVERTGKQVWIVPDLSSSYAKILGSRIALEHPKSNSSGFRKWIRTRLDPVIWYSLSVLKLTRLLGTWEL